MKAYLSKPFNVRLDHWLIGQLILPESSVLDLGCGYGELLSFLSKEKKVRGQGIEIDEQAIYNCVAEGLNVFHGDIDTGLSEYSDKSFDYVILNQSLQQVVHIETVMDEALRVGRKTIVGFPNFAYIKARYDLAFRGRAPVTKSLPYTWYGSPNLHFLSISDFIDYCRNGKISMEKKIFTAGNRKIYFAPNLFADAGIFLLSKNIG